SNPSAVLRAELYGMWPHQDADVIQNLVIVLDITLGRVAFRANIQAQHVNLGVGEISESCWDGESLLKPRVRNTKVIDDVIADSPGIGDDGLATVRFDCACELR